MDIAAEICDRLNGEWLPTIYKDKIRSQRTRGYKLEVEERENQAEIQYTLLGIELKVGKRRMACPDLATARYLRVFARIGCREFAVPYDITKISAAADELETAWQKALILATDLTGNTSLRTRAARRSRLIRTMREEIHAIGAGEAMPAFDRETRQRVP